MRHVFVLATLLGAALVGSYFTWTADETDELDEGEVEVFRGSSSEVEKITWKAEKLTVELERKQDDKGEYTWVVTTETKEIRKPEKSEKSEEDAEPSEEDAPDAEDGTEGDTPTDEASGTDEAPEVEETPEVEVIVTRFRGAKKADDLWDTFGPLVAIRELGARSAMDSEALGLAEPTATIDVQRRSGPVELTVGGETYGAKDRYVANADRVFLVDDGALRPLQYGTTQLVERAVQPLSETDIETIDIRQPDGRSVSFVQGNRDDRAKAFWGRADAPDEEDATASTWVGKVLKLRTNAYVKAEDVDGSLVPVFTYTVRGGDEAWSTEVLTIDGSDNSDYYARSDYARSLVKLTRSLASDAAEDIESVFE